MPEQTTQVGGKTYKYFDDVQTLKNLRFSDGHVYKSDMGYSKVSLSRDQQLALFRKGFIYDTNGTYKGTVTDFRKTTKYKPAYNNGSLKEGYQEIINPDGTITIKNKNNNNMFYGNGRVRVAGDNGYKMVDYDDYMSSLNRKDADDLAGRDRGSAGRGSADGGKGSKTPLQTTNYWGKGFNASNFGGYDFGNRANVNEYERFANSYGANIGEDAGIAGSQVAGSWNKMTDSGKTIGQLWQEYKDPDKFKKDFETKRNDQITNLQNQMATDNQRNQQRQNIQRIGHGRSYGDSGELVSDTAHINGTNYSATNLASGSRAERIAAYEKAMKNNGIFTYTDNFGNTYRKNIRGFSHRNFRHMLDAIAGMEVDDSQLSESQRANRDFVNKTGTAGVAAGAGYGATYSKNQENYQGQISNLQNQQYKQVKFGPSNSQAAVNQNASSNQNASAIPTLSPPTVTPTYGSQQWNYSMMNMPTSSDTSDFKFKYKPTLKNGGSIRRFQKGGRGFVSFLKALTGSLARGSKAEAAEAERLVGDLTRNQKAAAEHTAAVTADLTRDAESAATRFTKAQASVQKQTAKFNQIKSKIEQEFKDGKINKTLRDQKLNALRKQAASIRKGNSGQIRQSGIEVKNTKTALNNYTQAAEREAAESAEILAAQKKAAQEAAAKALADARYQRKVRWGTGLSAGLSAGILGTAGYMFWPSATESTAEAEEILNGSDGSTTPIQEIDDGQEAAQQSYENMAQPETTTTPVVITPETTQESTTPITPTIATTPAQPAVQPMAQPMAQSVYGNQPLNYSFFYDGSVSGRRRRKAAENSMQELYFTDPLTNQIVKYNPSIHTKDYFKYIDRQVKAGLTANQLYRPTVQPVAPIQNQQLNIPQVSAEMMNRWITPIQQAPQVKRHGGKINFITF